MARSWNFRREKPIQAVSPRRWLSNLDGLRCAPSARLTDHRLEARSNNTGPGELLGSHFAA